MREQNLVKFDELTTKVLNYLKMSFPIPVSIGPESLGLEISKKGEYDPSTGDNTEGEPYTEDERFFNPVIQWLYLSDYIHARERSLGYGLFDLVLTEKGLDMMGMKPESLQRK